MNEHLRSVDNAGAAMPMFAIVFGSMTDALGTLTPDGMISQVNHGELYFLFDAQVRKKFLCC